MSPLSRRHFMVQGLCGCALTTATSAPVSARVLPTQFTPLLTAGYKPTATDERGLWHEFAKLEDELAASSFLIRDAALTNYIASVAKQLLGAVAADLRIYVVRDPDFNASMAPNGMMIVHTGLLARVRNEAQLAAVLGHEAGHYLLRHSLRKWRDFKTKTAVVTTISMATDMAAKAGHPWYQLAYTVNNGLMLSLFSFSRAMETQADAFGLKLLNDAGYDPGAAAAIWAQVLEEREASAAARNMRTWEGLSGLSTHPPTKYRMLDLSDSANALQRAAGAAAYKDGRAQWLQAIASIRPLLLSEQIKLNDPGASLYLINSLAQDGWDGVLRYYEGEVYRLRDEKGDAQRAANAYAQALQYTDVPPEAFREHGYAQLKVGNTEPGRQALVRYLELLPAAPDGPMVRYTLGQ